MREKTLLYGALAATAIAAGMGVYRVRQQPVPLSIAPVSLIDAKRLADAEVPVRLTSSDGTGLKLTSFKAQAAIEDPLALTELHLVFENPEDRVLEGTFRITLPQGASLSRFAMKVGEVWQEGEVVEKQQARAAYEDFLHRKQDPALMEQGAGNEFSARVFPIPARGTKEIIVTYSEVLEAGASYSVPLRGLPMLGVLDIDVVAGGSKAASFGLHQTRFTPAQDFIVPAAQLPRSSGLRNGDLALARVVPFATSRPEPVASAVVLVDTSASRALGLTEQTAMVQRVLKKLDPNATITVAAFDQEVVSIYEGRASGFSEADARKIIDRGALGASDFEQAVVWAGEEAKKKNAKRIVLVGDGVATAGETDAQKLRTSVEKLRAQGVERMDAIASGGIRDDAFLRTVVRGVLDRDGVVLDAKLGPDAIARRLSEATSSGVPLKVDGATWSWPRTLDGLQAGDEVLVYMQIEPNKPIAIDVGGQPFKPDLRTIDRPLVERAWAQAKIQSLIEAPTEDPATTKKEIIALSTQHRVLSPHTALLVLETENDYRRFNIQRTANDAILSVRDGRIAVVQNPHALPPKEQAGQMGWSGEGSKDTKGRFAREKAREDALKDAEEFGMIGLIPATGETPDDIPAQDNDRSIRDGDGKQGGERLERGPSGGHGDVAGNANNRPRPEPRPDPSAATGVLDLSKVPGVNQESQRVIGGSSGDSLRQRTTATATTEPTPTRAPTPSGDWRAPSAAPPESTVDANVGGTVRPGTLVVQNGISQGEAQRVLRAAVPQIRACYTQALSTHRSLRGNLELRVVVDALGVPKSVDALSGPSDEGLKTCATSAIRAMRFPAPATGTAQFTTTFELVPPAGATPAASTSNVAATPATRPTATPYEGRLKVVMDLVARGDKDGAFAEANRWHAEEPGDVLSLVALGEVFEARGDVRNAARAYGSILELFSFRADSRRFAGERLERLPDPGALRLAIDTYKKSVEQRPDHPASHRLYAFTLLKHGEHEKAFEAIKTGATRTYPAGRFAGVDRILREDMGLISAAWMKAQPARAEEIRQKLYAAGGVEERGPSLRFVLNWETDANDVDFHIYDAKGGHAYYSQRDLTSGGSLYADVTTGYGPECFTIRAPADRRAYPYTLQAHYYARGPMGYGMGKLEVVEHDGHGNLSFEERPFVVMSDRAYVDLGTVDGSLRGKDTVTASLK